MSGGVKGSGNGAMNGSGNGSGAGSPGRIGRVVIDTGAQRLTGLPLGHEPAPEPIWSPLFAGMI